MSGDWIKWKGCECPVSKMTIVDVRLEDGSEHTDWSAGFWQMGVDSWQHQDDAGQNITAYRLSSPSAETRPGEQR